MGSTPITNLIKRDEVKKFRSDFKGQQERYTYLHEKCDFSLISQHCQGTINEISEGPHSTMDVEVKKSYDKYKSEIKKLKISKDDFYTLMFEEVSKKSLQENFLIKDFEVFHEIQDLFEKIYKDDINKINECKKVLDLFQKDFEDNLKIIVYDINAPYNKTLSLNCVLGINRNIKFKSDYQPDAFNLILTPFILDNEYLINDIAEIIQNVKSIHIVSIILNPIDERGNEFEKFNFNISNHRMFNKLLNAIYKNRNIKAVFLQCLSEHRIILSPESSNNIINKLQSETLVALYLGKFQMSDEFLNKIFFLLQSTKSLLYLGIDTKKIWRFLLSKILPSLEKNKTLKAISLTGFLEEDDELIEEFKEKLSKENKTIQIIYTGQESLIHYPMFEDDDDNENNGESSSSKN